MTNRQPVSIEKAWGLDADTDLWVFDKEADEYGLDPWLPVEIDKHTNGKDYFVSYNGGKHDIIVAPDFILYV